MNVSYLQTSNSATSRKRAINHLHGSREVIFLKYPPGALVKLDTYTALESEQHTWFHPNLLQYLWDQNWWGLHMQTSFSMSHRVHLLPKTTDPERESKTLVTSCSLSLQTGIYSDLRTDGRSSTIPGIGVKFPSLEGIVEDCICVGAKNTTGKTG
jgi:hypothetical protein